MIFVQTRPGAVNLSIIQKLRSSNLPHGLHRRGEGPGNDYPRHETAVSISMISGSLRNIEVRHGEKVTKFRVEGTSFSETYGGREELQTHRPGFNSLLIQMLRGTQTKGSKNGVSFPVKTGLKQRVTVWTSVWNLLVPV